MKALALALAAVAAAAALAAAWGTRTEGYGAHAEDYKAFFQETVTAFVEHVRQKHADDPRGQNLLGSFKGLFGWETSAGLASYNRKTGTVYLNLADYADQPLTAATRAYIRSQVLHEMAHSTPSRHDRNWQDAFVWFLKLATEELGWVVMFKGCSRCPSYGMCSRDMCPKCLWEFEPSTCPQPGIPGSWNLMNCSSAAASCTHNGTPAPAAIPPLRPPVRGDPLPE